MRKLICDRCAKECNELYEQKVPTKSLGYGNYMTEKIEVCEECNCYINKNVNAFNESLVFTRLAFYKAIMPEYYERIKEDEKET